MDAARMRELLSGLTCPLCGGTRGDTLLVVIDSPSNGLGSVRAQCVRCHLFWSFSLDADFGLTAPVAERYEPGAERFSQASDPISLDEVLEVHRALGEHDGPLTDLFRLAS